jgi:hypothetical protein
MTAGAAGSMPIALYQRILDACGRRSIRRASAGAAIGGLAFWEAAAAESVRPADWAWFVLGGAATGLVSSVLLITCESVRPPRATSAGGRAAYSIGASAAVVVLFAMIGLLAVVVAALYSAR